MTLSDFWQLLAGLGLFLYGMFHLEDVMKQVEGRTFKLFLQKHTSKKFSAILSGTFVTSILQSSSIVNLIVLSFVGAGMLTMRNALGVTMGANIGGTFNSWLLALLGFKVEIGNFSLPIIGISGIGLIFFRNKRKIYPIIKFCMGFGILFLGLEFMKSSMDALITKFDFTPYLSYNRIIFVIIGFVITALIQTSAATVVIVLSALYAKIIPIETAVAVVLGAELGTTIKLLIGSIGGIAAKKRVAFGNIFFNIVTSLFGFILLVPIINFIQNIIGFQDPILILVSFQTLINIIGVILFYYFLNSFGNFLEKCFVSEEKTATYFLPTTSVEIPDTAIEMTEKEVQLFIHRIIDLNIESFKLNMVPNPENEFKPYLEKINLRTHSFSYLEKYNYIKQAEGEILIFYSKMAEESLKKETLIRLNQLIASVRNAMYSAKGMKDSVADRKDFSNSANELKFDKYTLIRTQMSEFYVEINKLFLIENKTKIYKMLEVLLHSIKLEYEIRMESAYNDVAKDRIKQVDISTLLNVNRELYASSRALLFSLKDYFLDTEQAETFENIPTGIVK